MSYLKSPNSVNSSISTQTKHTYIQAKRFGDNYINATNIYGSEKVVAALATKHNDPSNSFGRNMMQTAPASVRKQAMDHVRALMTGWW